MKPLALTEAFDRFDDHWRPRIVGRVNDVHVKVAKLLGSFEWHRHPHEDELFWVHRGRLRIELRDGAVTLGPGEMVVVPRGVEHRPVAEAEVELVLVEPVGTVNTGTAGGKRTVDDEWLPPPG